MPRDLYLQEVAISQHQPQPGKPCWIMGLREAHKMSVCDGVCIAPHLMCTKCASTCKESEFLAQPGHSSAVAYRGSTHGEGVASNHSFKIIFLDGGFLSACVNDKHTVGLLKW